MPSAAELGISEQEFQDAVNLEKLYTIARDSLHSSCTRCGSSPITYYKTDSIDFLCSNCARGKTHVRRLGEAHVRNHDVQKFERKYGSATTRRHNASSRGDPPARTRGHDNRRYRNRESTTESATETDVSTASSGSERRGKKAKRKSAASGRKKENDPFDSFEDQNVWQGFFSGPERGVNDDNRSRNLMRGADMRPAMPQQQHSQSNGEEAMPGMMGLLQQFGRNSSVGPINMTDGPIGPCVNRQSSQLQQGNAQNVFSIRNPLMNRLGIECAGPVVGISNHRVNDGLANNLRGLRHNSWSDATGASSFSDVGGRGVQRDGRNLAYLSNGNQSATFQPMMNAQTMIKPAIASEYLRDPRVGLSQGGVTMSHRGNNPFQQRTADDNGGGYHSVPMYMNRTTDTNARGNQLMNNHVQMMRPSQGMLMMRNPTSVFGQQPQQQQAYGQFQARQFDYLQGNGSMNMGIGMQSQVQQNRMYNPTQQQMPPYHYQQQPPPSSFQFKR